MIFLRNLDERVGLIVYAIFYFHTSLLYIFHDFIPLINTNCLFQIVVIMRGLPGSGKTHVAKLIRVSAFSGLVPCQQGKIPTGQQGRLLLTEALLERGTYLSLMALLAEGDFLVTGSQQREYYWSLVGLSV